MPIVSLDNPVEEDLRLEPLGSRMDPEDELGWKEVVGALQKELLRMLRPFRNVMLLRRGEQLPIPEVAQRLGLSVPAAKSRSSRARRDCATGLESTGGEKGPAHCWKIPSTNERPTSAPAGIDSAGGLISYGNLHEVRRSPHTRA